jgi:signal peptidase I
VSLPEMLAEPAVAEPVFVTAPDPMPGEVQALTAEPVAGDFTALPLTLAPVDGIPSAGVAPAALVPSALVTGPTVVSGPVAHVEPAGPSAWERLGEEVLTWFKTLASAAVYATLIVTFICQVARVEGHSMSPTLEDNDRLIVNKLIYRLSVPQRDDIVMLYYPVNPDKSFVKRVIAKENDTVRIVDGKVYVNGEAREDLFVPPTYRSHEDFGSLTVKPGYYFVMGDHRNNSSDSREWGEVPRKYIIGKVQLRWWPLTSARLFY